MNQPALDVADINSCADDPVGNEIHKRDAATEVSSSAWWAAIIGYFMFRTLRLGHIKRKFDRFGDGSVNRSIV